MAEACAQRAGDFAFSLLLLSCLGDRAGMRALAESARRAGQLNVAFLALLLAGDAAACLRLLEAEGKLPEAAFFSLSYLPSQAHAAFALWRERLRAEKHIAAELLADPAVYGSFFAGLEKALALERALAPLRAMDVAAEEYAKYREMIEGEGLHLKDLRVVTKEEREEEEKEKEGEEEKGQQHEEKGQQQHEEKEPQHEEKEPQKPEDQPQDQEESEKGESAVEPVEPVEPADHEATDERPENGEDGHKEREVTSAETTETRTETDETAPDAKKGGNSGQESSPNIDEEFGELLEGETLPQEGEEGDIDIDDLEREWNA